MRRNSRKFLIAAAVVAGLSASLLSGHAAQAQVVFGVAPPAVSVQIRLAPPPLPVYAQPPCPLPGYLWTPGYWAYGPAGYYWIPGAWVAPPAPGLLWTPGYWGWVGGVYSWHRGYWGHHVGFYGGVNYGFGYGGVGFSGGRWVGRDFAYNAAVANVNANVIHNTYRETVIEHPMANRVSFNGGPGGIAMRPGPREEMAARERHIAPTQFQQRHFEQAQHNPEFAAHANGGQGRGPEGMPRQQAEQHQQLQRQQAEQRQQMQLQHQQAERQQFERQQAEHQQRPPQNRPQPEQRRQQPERREAPREHEDRDRH